MRRGTGPWVGLGAVLACLLVGTASCSEPTRGIERASARPGPPSSLASPGAPRPSAPGGAAGSEAAATGGSPRTSTADPGRLTTPLRTADLLVTSPRTIPAATRRAVAGTRGVSAVLPMSLAALSVNGRTLSVAAADPAGFRRFTPFRTARSDEVWARVAAGEVAVDPALPRRLEEDGGYLRLGASADAPEVHIGAYAPIVKQVSAVVNPERGRQLALPDRNALLVSTGTRSPATVAERLRRVLGPGPTLQTLALEFDTGTATAVLSGASVTSAVGTFTYVPRPDGTITPDPAWVRSYIRRESVPILGTVTCNKGVLPQLRAALSEVVSSGLAQQIHPGQFGGCYYPRFIARDPAKGLSLHAWGIAVDLNVPENQRGTVGRMDPRVVAIFKRWGFAWGGDWNYTDPMHFEMASVFRVR